MRGVLRLASHILSKHVYGKWSLSVGEAVNEAVEKRVE
jgi:hypothetical protein